MLNTVKINMYSQVVAPLPSEHPARVARALETVRFQWAGVSRSQVADNGAELYMEAFRLSEDCGAHAQCAAVEAPWQTSVGIFATPWTDSGARRFSKLLARRREKLAQETHPLRRRMTRSSLHAPAGPRSLLRGVPPPTGPPISAMAARVTQTAPLSPRARAMNGPPTTRRTGTSANR